MTKVIARNEVELDGTKYPLVGRVESGLASNFPQKIVIGDYTKASNPLVDSWVIDDQRGGIGVEEMDETKHANRCWFSTCDLSFDGHIILPRLATSVSMPVTGMTLANAGLNDWSGGTPDNWSVSKTAQTTISQETSTKKEGTSAVKFVTASTEDTDYGYIYQNASGDIAEYKGKYVAVGAWVKASIHWVQLWVDDGVSNTSTAHSGGGDWEYLVVVRQIDSSATRLRVCVGVPSTTDAQSYTYYIDDVGLGTFNTITDMATFNNDFYVANGGMLIKIDNDTGNASLAAVLPNDITALVATVNSTMLIYQGDEKPYLYLDTDGVLHKTDSANATLGVIWDSKAWKFDSTTNKIYYSVTPNASSPSWAENGTLDEVSAGKVNSLYTDSDADGNDIIYAATAVGLHAHDTTNAQFVRPKLKTPDHPNGGKGACIWKEAAYISAGLDVWRYIPDGSPAVIESAGLSRDGGIPSEYNGEIVKLIAGYNYLFALIDSTQTSGTSTSTIMSYSGTGWQVFWAAGSTGGSMHTGAVSSAYDYRLWFDHDDTLYYIQLERSILNPLKLTSHNYASSAFHVTPWFDGNWQVGNKRALALTLNCSGMSENETVVVKYRTDHSYTNLGSGWTTLGTISSNGETTYKFPNSSTPTGVTIRSIQFRFDLARGSTTTNTPDIQYAVFEYQKLLPRTWNYSFTVDCSRSFDGKSPKQLLSALKTTAEKESLVTFTYNDTTHYVEVLDAQGDVQSGENREGKYRVAVRVPQ